MPKRQTAAKKRRTKRNRQRRPFAGKELEITWAIAERLSNGETLNSICREEGMPAPRTVNEWRQENAEINAIFARARDLGFDALAAECLQIANTPQEGVETTTDEEGSISEKRGDMLGHRKLQIETRLKLLAKWDPKRYGDKSTVEHAGQIDSHIAVTALSEDKWLAMLEKKQAAIARRHSPKELGNGEAT